MKKDKKIFDWDYNCGDRYIKKFPRHIVNTYPEGIQHESMRAAYKPYSYLTDCWEKRDLARHCGFSSKLEKWLRAQRGSDANLMFKKYVKRSQGDMKWWQWHLQIDYPERISLNNMTTPHIVDGIESLKRFSISIDIKEK